MVLKCHGCICFAPPRTPGAPPILSVHGAASLSPAFPPCPTPPASQPLPALHPPEPRGPQNQKLGACFKPCVHCYARPPASSNLDLLLHLVRLVCFSTHLWYTLVAQHLDLIVGVQAMQPGCSTSLVSWTGSSMSASCSRRGTRDAPENTNDAPGAGSEDGAKDPS